MEIVVRILRLYGLPREVVASQMEAMRGEDYEMLSILHVPGQPLRQLRQLLAQVDADLFIGAPGSSLAGMELRQLDLRVRSGAWVLAVVRDGQVLHNPAPDFRLGDADQIVLIGAREQLSSAFTFLHAAP